MNYYVQYIVDFTDHQKMPIFIYDILEMNNFKQLSLNNILDIYSKIYEIFDFEFEWRNSTYGKIIIYLNNVDFFERKIIFKKKFDNEELYLKVVEINTENSIEDKIDLIIKFLLNMILIKGVTYDD